MKKTVLDNAIRKAKKGKRKGFEILIDSYGKKVFGYIYSLTKDKYLSDDIYQEVWMKVIKNIVQYEETRSFSAWLITIARNATYDTLRKNKVKHLPLYNIEVASNESETPEELILKRERLKELDKRISKLSERDQTLIILRCFEGLNYDEIAKFLSIKPSTVKWQLQDAKKRLRNITDKEAANEM